MKILFVGQLGEGQTSRMRMQALRALGHEIVEVDSEAAWRGAGFLERRLQRAAESGPAVWRLNRAVARAAEATRPDLLWAEKQELLRAETLRTIRGRGTRLLHFTPDPYFTLSWKRTRTMDAALPCFDYLLTAKRYELAQYRRQRGAVEYLPLGYCEWTHRPLLPDDEAARRRFACEVGFVGGWEPRREQMLEPLARAGLQLKIWGYSWDHLVDGKWSLRRELRLRQNARGAPFSLRRNAALGPAVVGGEVYGDEYARALSSARLGIGFLRTICPDQHTTRSFEIPACGSLLLADRSDEHREFFQEGEEADFFSSTEELIEKARFYLGNQAARERVARNGLARCRRSGYSYRERLATALAALGLS